MRRHPIVITALAALGLVVLVAGCGGSASTPAAPAGTAPAATAAPSADDPGTAPSAPAGDGSSQAPAQGGGTKYTGTIANTRTPEDLRDLLPNPLCGDELTPYVYTGEQWLEGAAPSALQDLASYGKSPDDVMAVMEISLQADVCSAAILRVKGATSEQALRLHDVGDSDDESTEVTIDGRKVWKHVRDEEVKFYYPVGDAVVTVTALDEAVAKSLLALMPTE